MKNYIVKLGTCDGVAALYFIEKDSNKNIYIKYIDENDVEINMRYIKLGKKAKQNILKLQNDILNYRQFLFEDFLTKDRTIEELEQFVEDIKVFSLYSQIIKDSTAIADNLYCDYNGWID